MLSLSSFSVSFPLSLFLSLFCFSSYSDDIGSFIDALPKVAPSVSSSGKNPPCPPSTSSLPASGTDYCQGFTGLPAKAYPLRQVETAWRGKTTPVSIVDEKDLPALYKTVMGLHLPWTHPRDCVQRALILSYCLGKALGLQTAKLIVPADGGLITPQYADRSRRVGWPQHQAVMIMVKDKTGAVNPYVIDPATKTHIAPQAEWESFLEGRGKTVIGTPSAMSVDEATIRVTPAFESDLSHMISHNWAIIP